MHIYFGGVDGTGGKGIKGCHVCVLPLHCLLSGRAVVNAAHHFGTDQRTYKDNVKIINPSEFTQR